MYDNHSTANSRNVVTQLASLVAGAGVEHRSNGAMFMEGERLTLGVDVPALKQRAKEWLTRVGPDTSGGWLISHPLSKLYLYQQHLAEGEDSSSEEAAVADGEATHEPGAGVEAGRVSTLGETEGAAPAQGREHARPVHADGGVEAAVSALPPPRVVAAQAGESCPDGVVAAQAGESCPDGVKAAPLGAMEAQCSPAPAGRKDVAQTSLSASAKALGDAMEMEHDQGEDCSEVRSAAPTEARVEESASQEAHPEYAKPSEASTAAMDGPELAPRAGIGLVAG